MNLFACRFPFTEFLLSTGKYYACVKTVGKEIRKV